MRYIQILFLSSALPLIFGSFHHAEAKSTFLPDWQETDIGSEGDHNKDENYCIEAEDTDGSKFYHKATGCPAPKIFDETCPTDPDYISKCYCPEEYKLTCDAPLRGNSQYSCDGLWASCCDTTCPAGSDSNTSCYGTDVKVTVGYNGCGDACSYCRPCNEDCTISCGYDQDATPTGSYSECGTACVSCSDRCSPAPSESGCPCGSYSDCSDGCGGLRTCCYACQTPDPEPEPTPTPPCSGCECDNSCGNNNGGGNDTPVTPTDECKGDKNCSGQTTPCTSNQTQKSSCKDCSGKAHYVCEDKPVEQKCSDSSYSKTKPNCQADYDLKTDAAGCYKCQANSCVSERSSLSGQISKHNSYFGGKTLLDFCDSGCTCSNYTIYPTTACRNAVSELSSRLSSYNSKCQNKLNVSVKSGCPTLNYGNIAYNQPHTSCKIGYRTSNGAGGGGSGQVMRPDN